MADKTLEFGIKTALDDKGFVAANRHIQKIASEALKLSRAINVLKLPLALLRDFDKLSNSITSINKGLNETKNNIGNINKLGPGDYYASGTKLLPSHAGGPGGYYASGKRGWSVDDVFNEPTRSWTSKTGPQSYSRLGGGLFLPPHGSGGGTTGGSGGGTTGGSAAAAGGAADIGLGLVGAASARYLANTIANSIKQVLGAYVSAQQYKYLDLAVGQASFERSFGMQAAHGNPSSFMIGMSQYAQNKLAATTDNWAQFSQLGSQANFWSAKGIYSGLGALSMLTGGNKNPLGATWNNIQAGALAGTAVGGIPGMFWGGLAGGLGSDTIEGTKQTTQTEMFTEALQKIVTTLPYANDALNEYVARSTERMHSNRKLNRISPSGKSTGFNYGYLSLGMESSQRAMAEMLAGSVGATRAETLMPSAASLVKMGFTQSQAGSNLAMLSEGTPKDAKDSSDALFKVMARAVTDGVSDPKFLSAFAGILSDNTISALGRSEIGRLGDLLTSSLDPSRFKDLTIKDVEATGSAIKGLNAVFSGQGDPLTRVQNARAALDVMTERAKTGGKTSTLLTMMLQDANFADLLGGRNKVLSRNFTQDELDSKLDKMLNATVENIPGLADPGMRERYRAAKKAGKLDKYFDESGDTDALAWAIGKQIGGGLLEGEAVIRILRSKSGGKKLSDKERKDITDLFENMKAGGVGVGDEFASELAGEEAKNRKWAKDLTDAPFLDKDGKPVINEATGKPLSVGEAGRRANEEVAGEARGKAANVLRGVKESMDQMKVDAEAAKAAFKKMIDSNVRAMEAMERAGTMYRAPRGKM